MVHQKINNNAVLLSGIDNVLKNQLGYSNGIKTNLNAKQVWEWFEDGGKQEDDPICRSKYHFHDPTKTFDVAGLSNAVINLACLNWGDGSSIVWSQHQGNLWSWQKGREYYHQALTAAEKSSREQKFADTFRAVGQVMHLLSDASVPEHVRNDIHIFPWFDNPDQSFPQIGSWTYETWCKHNASGLNTEANSIAYNSLVNTSQVAGLVPITNFWDTIFSEGYNLNPVGLAEYTNLNFVSSDTIFKSYTYPQRINMFTIEPITAEDNIIDARVYFRSITSDAKSIDHLASTGYLWSELSALSAEEANDSRFVLDDRCFKDYSDILVPKAVGYSAGLLNYFFRGALEISAPARCLYSLIDGSSSSDQKFTKIKAKVKNITPSESIIGGSLIAVAKYKVWTGYESDLSNGQPTSESFATDFSYSVSAPVTLDPTANAEDIQALNSDSKEFTFNFADSPIPAGITDLYLQIVFKGTLGNELDNAIAVGFKDLSEPTHMNFWNITDFVYNSGQLRPAIESETDIIDEKVAFCPSNLPVQDDNEYQVQYTQLHPARFGRLIFISDPAVQIYYGQSDIPDTGSPLNTWSWTWPAVYQNNAVGENTGVYQYRGRGFNQLSAYYNSLTQPDAGFWNAAWPVSALDAVSATSFNW